MFIEPIKASGSSLGIFSIIFCDKWRESPVIKSIQGFRSQWRWIII